MEKIAWVMELQENKVDEYVRVHRKSNVWPEILAVNKKAGVLKEEIYHRMMSVFEADLALKRERP